MNAATYTFTREQLKAACLEWEYAHRAGECMRTTEEALALPVEQVAEENADTLIRLLTS